MSIAAGRAARLRPKPLRMAPFKGSNSIDNTFRRDADCENRTAAVAAGIKTMEQFFIQVVDAPKFLWISSVPSLPSLVRTFPSLSKSISMMGASPTFGHILRREGWKPRLPDHGRGCAKLCMDRVMHADRGADIDFLVGKDSRPVQRESH